MSKLKKFFVYVDDGANVFKLAVPAKNEKDARKFAEGNGEIVCVKEAPEDFFISVEKVYDALKAARFGQTEIDFIFRTLIISGIAE